MSQDQTTNKTEGFSAYILLSEPLEFSTTEIEEALLEDFPTLDIRPEQALSMPQNCDTDQFITAPILLGAGGADSGIVSLVRLPGYGTWDPHQLSPSQKIQFPSVDQELRRNASYICVSVGTQAEDETSQFRAARLCSCLAAVFAKLPIAVAVYWETADHFLRPEDVVAMANKVITDEFPIEQWIGLHLNVGGGGRNPIMGSTNGLRHFQGTEISFAQAPVDLNVVVTTLLATATMITSYGHSFHDGDTIGSSGQSEDESFRIRHVPAGTFGVPCALWLLVHPQSTVNHEKLLGKLKRKSKAKADRVEMNSQRGFFKRLMRGGPDA